MAWQLQVVVLCGHLALLSLIINGSFTDRVLLFFLLCGINILINWVALGISRHLLLLGLLALRWCALLEWSEQFLVEGLAVWSAC